MFDCPEPVQARYCNDMPRRVIEVWKVNRQVRKIPAGALLRIQAESAFVLHWSDDEWNTAHDTTSLATALGVDYADIQVDLTQKAPLRFTFNWPEDNQWQGKDFVVQIDHAAEALKRSASGSSA